MIKRVLSLLLVLVMVFSLLPVSALAEGDEEPAEVIEEVEEPAPEPSEEPDPEPQPVQEPEPDPEPTQEPEPEPELMPEPEIETAVIISQQPADVEPAGGEVVFSVTASVNTDAVPGYQWQKLDESVTYADAGEREAAWKNIDGETSATLRLTGLADDAALAEAMRYAYRCVLTAGDATATTNEVHILKPAGRTPLSTGDSKDTITSGYFGDDDELSWVLDDEGALTIGGFGFMPFYEQFTKHAPWYDYRAQITKIVIEDGVTGIGEFAFHNCSNASRITIPDSVTYIGKRAFDGCDSLSNITIPSSMTKIEDGAFSGCGLTSFTVPSTVTSIGPSAFNGCTKLTSITIPNSVTSIGYAAFNSCSSLKSITLPSGITSISQDLFRDCGSLKSVSIPESVTVIYSDAFWGCSSLTSISIPDGVTSVGAWAFRECSSLTSISIPDGITVIKEGVFTGCSGLTSLIIPTDVTVIERVAFWDCSGLTSLTIPSGVTRIGDRAFNGCSSLTDIYFGGTEDQWSSIVLGEENTILESLKIHYNSSGPGSNELEFRISGGKAVITGYDADLPETLTIPGEINGYPVIGIDAEAFKNCTDIKRVIIPASVTSIGDKAFYGCSKLLNAEFQGAKPEFGSDVFGKCSQDFAIWATGSNINGWPFTEWETVFVKDFLTQANSEYLIYKNLTDEGYPCYQNPGQLVIYHSYSGSYDQNTQKTVSATYSDSYFSDNSDLNYALADLSLCMCMATSASPHDTFYENTDHKSDRYIRTAFETAGFKNDYYSYRYGDSRDTYDDEAYAIAWKELPDGTPLVAVGVRSNGYGGGWVSNVNVYSGSSPNNAYGFYNSAREIVNGNSARNNIGLKNYLTLHGIDSRTAKIWVFGFSRGGAISNCIGKILNDDAAFTNSNLFVYTFATPRTVQAGTEGEYPGIYNIVQEMDVVPQVPLEGWGYTRYGITYSLPCKSVTGLFYGIRLKSMENAFTSLMVSFGSRDTYKSYKGQELLVDELISILYKAFPTKENYGYSLQGTTIDLLRTHGSSASLSHIDDTLRYLVGAPFYIQLATMAENYKNYDLLDWIAAYRSLKHTAEVNTIPAYDIANELLDLVDRLIQKAKLSALVGVVTGGNIPIAKTVLVNTTEYKTISYILDFKEEDVHPFDTAALMQHWPEEYLCWLRSGNKDNTLKSTKESRYSRAYLECPVDVTVYASDGTIVAQVINEEITVEELTIFLDGAGGKEIIIPEDDVYRIEITSREDDASMNYVLTECSIESGMKQREIFLDIPLTEDQALTTEVNFGDTVITTGDEVLTPDLTLNESSYLSCEVTANSSGNGTVTASRLYTPGDVAMVMAEPEDGYALLGWYEGETLVSRDTVYAFTVTGSRSFTAVFAPMPDGIALDKEYMAMASEQEAALAVSGIADEWMPFVTWSVENADENSDVLILTVSDGTVTAAGAGTAYAVASVTASGTTYSARCRVDVVAGDGEHPIAEDVAAEKNGVSGVRLPVTKTTTELFITEYARIQVVPELTENYMKTQSTVIPTPAPAEDTGVAIESAAFTIDTVSQLFRLRVVDDRTLEIIPTDYALENYASVKSSYSSPIDVTVDGQVFTTDAFTLTVKKTEPSIKAGSITLNSFFADTKPVSFTGGTVTSAEPDPASPLPDWLSFDSASMSFTYTGAQNLKQSAKVTLLVIPEGWCIKKPVSVSVSTKSTAPTMKFSPSSMTLNPGTGDAAFTIFTVTPASFNSEEVTVSRIMESKTVYANNTVLNVAINGNIAVVTAPYVDGKAHTYKVYLNVAGKETAFTVKTLAASKAVDVTLKAKGAIDLAVEDSPVTITATMKNYHTDEASFALSSICKAGTTADVQDLFNIDCIGNTFTVTENGNPDLGSYTATVTATCANGSTVSKAVSFTVKRSTKIPTASITLKTAGGIDVLRPGTEVTLTPTVKNNYTWTMAAGDISVTKTYDGATRTKVSLDATDSFNISVRDGKYVVTAKAGVSHADKFSVQATVSGMTSKAVTLKVMQGKVKITQSAKAVTLLKTDRYSQGIVVLTFEDKSLSGIARVELDAKSETLFDLKDFGNGKYAIAYDSNMITTVKAQTVKLLVFMEGNRTASANTTISVKVSFS